MKFILDTDILAKEDIGISGCLYLLAMYFKSPISNKTFEALNDRGLTFVAEYFNDEPKIITLSQNGMELSEKILTESTIEEKTEKGEDRFKVLADKLRDLFPKGKKQGTNLQWKDSTVMIAARLKTLVKKYEVQFTDEQAIQATKDYISSFNGDYRFMQTLKYFIFKNTNNGGGLEQNSQLLSFIDNLGQQSTNLDWTSELR